MKSQASRRYAAKRESRPLKTRQRSRMYDSLEVSPSKKSVSPHSPLDTVNRSTRDSYLLRVTKETVLNANYNPNSQLVKPRPKRQVIDKAAFERIIGDIRGEDFSLPLVSTADRRCHKAFETIGVESQLVNSRDLQNYRKKYQNLNFDKQMSFNHSEQYQKEFHRQKSLKKMLSQKSTDISSHFNDNTVEYSKKRNQKTSQLHDVLKKIRDFDHTSGHTYGDELSKPSLVPEFYDIQSSNEAFVKKSMSNARGYNKFDQYRDKISTRVDRLDPNWGMRINYEDLNMYPKRTLEKIPSIQKMTKRKPLEVYSKYPIRQNMSLEVPQSYRE